MMAKRPPAQTEDESPEYVALRTKVGVRLRDARERAGLSQIKLAAKAGTGQSYIFEIEMGGANLTLKLLSQLAVALDMDVRDLLPETKAAPLSNYSLAQMHALLERLATVLSQRQSEEEKILSELRDVAQLRFALEKFLGSTE